MAELKCELLKDSLLTGSASVISPNGKFLASTMVSRLVLRELSKISQILNVFQCLDKIDRIEFSPDSQYVLCGLYARNTVQVVSVSDFEWKCRISEGVAGIISVCWAPDSRTIITESDFGICLSAWSLCEEKHSIISFPKPSHKGFKSQYIAFSDDKQFMAVVHRIELQDQIGIYSLHPLNELIKFKSKSYDISSIQWTPRDSNIITMDSPLHYACCVYSATGEVFVCLFLLPF
jgi:WD40 repeat protein